MGISAAEEQRRIATGEWELARPNVIRLSGSPLTPEQGLMAACLAAGPSAIASHQSAAWLWDLVDLPPRHAVTVLRHSPPRLTGVDVHRPVDYPARPTMRRNIPCTNPLRALVDLAAVGSDEVLDGAVDRALARRLLTVEALEAEIGRLSRRGRRGVGRLRGSLIRRGYLGAPFPSVLESRTLRLLHQYGIVPTGAEITRGPEGRWRIDIELAPSVLMEVDGHAYHADPEQTAEDERRRNQLRLDGHTVLVYTWRTITQDSRRVIADVRQALSHQAGTLTRR